MLLELGNDNTCEMKIRSAARIWKDAYLMVNTNNRQPCYKALGCNLVLSFINYQWLQVFVV